MGLKNRKTKNKKDNKPKEKVPLIWDPSDGVTWHDFIGLFLSLLKFFWRLVKLVFAPVFWVYAENVRMIRFIRAKGEDRPMNRYEREFVESIPVIYSLTGLIGGILISFFVIFEFKDAIDAFFEKLSFDFIIELILGIASIFGWIWKGIVWFFTKIADLIKIIAGLVNADPFIAFTFLAVIGIVIVLLWILLAEKGVFKKISGFLNKTFGWIIESPDLFRFNVQTYYRKFNHKVTAKLIGEERMATRTQVYFKKSLFYTLLVSVWSFGSGIYVGLGTTYETEWQQVLFTSFVLFIAGMISGFLFLIFIARFLDSLNRRTYIASEFILEDDEIDEDALAKETKKLIDSKPWLKEYVPKRKDTSEDEEKPWKKGKKTKKEEVKEEVEE